MYSIQSGHTRWWLPVVIVCLGLVSVWAYALQWHQPAAPKWQILPVARGNIEATVAAVGTLQPLHSVEVGAQVSGQITRLHVQAGDVVVQGQVLAEIDASVFMATVEAGRAELAALQAQLDDARAQHTLAQQQHRRRQRMAALDATSQESLEVADATLQSAGATVRRIQAAIGQLNASLRADEARLGYTRIIAPMAGTVTSVDVKEGQTLNATYQTPAVMRIADLSRMQVWTQVSEADIRKIRAGQQARFTTLGAISLDEGERHWQGRVRQILPAPVSKGGQDAASGSTGQVVQYTVLFDVSNEDGALMPLMTAQVSFITAQATDVLLAPLAVLEWQAGHYRVRVLDEGGQPQARSVRIGRRDRVAAEVLEGLAEGEALVAGQIEPEAGRRWFQW